MKKFLVCMQMCIFFIIILRALYCMLSLQENQWKKLYLRMTVLDTKYKAEMNAV